MNANQYGGLLTVLTEIRDRLPESDTEDVPTKALTIHHLDGTKTVTLTRPAKEAVNMALTAMLGMLDGWIEGAQEDHEAMGHRDENRGSECWRSFAPADIRNMINDAARELGLTEFPAPVEPREDQGL